MEKTKRLTPKRIVLLAVVLALAVALTLLGLWLAREFSGGIHEILAEEEYTYVNPDETKAQTDPGMRIDGVLDEEVYQESNWLHLQNNDGGNNVNIAMTSHFGEQGMYFVFDVTESVPIYVNLDRAPYLNSCIELYLIPPYLSKLQGNSMFEIDLLPTGDMIFKKSNGKYGYENVASTDDIMACLGAVTKGGPVNTPECYGYALELFIPWDYMRWLGIDVAAIQDGFVYINPAHITSNNYTGTDNNLDRYWYHYAQQLGADFADVPQYFRFNGEGIMGTSPLNLENGEHHTFTGGTGVLPGMKTPVTVTPAEGYALTSVLLDGQEQLHNVDFGEDGSVTLWIRGTGVSQTVTARTEAISEGKKTLRGKLRVSGILSEVLPGTLVTYTGPLGEKPVELDAEGNFELKDLDQGYYVLKVEKEGYSTFTRSICLNRDVYTELTLKAPVFYTTRGACWILEEESFGILYKTGGAGHVMSHASYNDFTFETYIKYDPELAKQSDDDNHLQQRSGIRILFSNGKYWHIDLMLENGQYVVQYAKHAGKDSIFNWRNVHALTQEQINKYTSPEGIKLTVMRQENRAAICLDGKILFVEELPKEYASLTAQMGMEAWIANSTVMKVPFSIKPSAAVEKVPGAIFNAAQTWDISSQHQGIVRKTGVAGNTTWLESVINCNDVTTTARDLSPNTGDYSMIYIFRFSNGEQFRVRLNHTDTDGKYRIQSMAGSTVFDAWRNHYTLTDQQAAKVMGKGISYRVLVSGTTAHVFLDGEAVCTYDLSKVVATGKPSGIEKATVKIALRLDGNLNKTTEIPFKLASTASDPQTPTQPEEPEEPDEPVDPEKRVEFVIPQLANGTVKTVKAEYAVGSKVTLAVTPAAGYVQKLTINGKPLMLDWKTNTYTFIATEKRYEITSSFVQALSWKPADAGNVRFDLSNQGHNVINVYYPNDTSSWWADIDGEYSAFTVKAKNYLSVEDSKESNGNTGFAVALRMTLSNGKNYAFRIFNDKGTYACDYYGAAGSATGWGGWQNIHSYASEINGEGVDFKLERTNANTLKISVNGTVIISYTMNGVTENDKVVSVGLCHYGNKGEKVEIPFTLAKQDGEIAIPVTVTIPTLQNGTVTADKGSYDVGDTVTLTVTPAEGYSQKLYINGEPVMLDWKTNAYSFVATETSYTVTGSFVPGLDLVASDAGRWDSANHAHGILNAYYPVNNDAWFMDFKGEYASLTVKAKNYRSIEDSKDGVEGSVGYAVILRVTLDNGKVFAFRIYNDKGTYAYAWYVGGGSATGWGGWKNIHSAYADAFQGDGVDFKLERISGNQLALSLNGTVVETYTMSGVTGSNKVVSMGIQHNGNKGEKVEIPFKLTTQEGELVTPVTLTLPTTQNGTVTADKGSYILGDTVTLTVSPAAGYYQKLYVNGQPLLLDWKTNTYSFVATETTYNITGSFEADAGMKPFDASRWNLSNQAHGVINTKYNASHGNESWWLDIEGEYTSFACTLKNYRPVSESYDGVSGGPFRAVIRMTFSNGKNYAFMIWVDGSQRYCYNRCDYSGSSSGSGGAWRNINEKDPAGAALFNTTGAEFKIERVSGNQLKLTVNGTEMETFTMAETGADAKVVSVGMRLYGNPDKDIRIPFKLA